MGTISARFDAGKDTGRSRSLFTDRPAIPLALQMCVALMPQPLPSAAVCYLGTGLQRARGSRAWDAVAQR